MVVDQSQLFPLNSTKSEDCLYLNVFTPSKTSKSKAYFQNFKINNPVTRFSKVTESREVNCKAVMFFIFGGAFTEGDGTDQFYGADFIVGEDVILVTSNYRLGPWGFANFDLKDYTGNMGFWDQQLALEWVKRNIKYFGGDPKLISVFGESAGELMHISFLKGVPHYFNFYKVEFNAFARTIRQIDKMF